jgi:hypothetical protein
LGKIYFCYIIKYKSLGKNPLALSSDLSSFFAFPSLFLVNQFGQTYDSGNFIELRVQLRLLGYYILGFEKYVIP